MNAGYATIITPITRGGEHGETLKRFLRTNVEPRYDPATIVQCRATFPFDKIQGLHFCSFTILDKDGEFDPCLVFEATFDGSRDFFLDALLTVAPAAIDEIYRHCEGYPESGLAVPELIKDYLARHDLGAQTFFRGSFGRTVEQIRGEAHIYDALVEFVCNGWRCRKAMPATSAGLQHELQQRVIRDKPANRWAEQMAAVPREVAGRGAVATAAVAAVTVVACVLGALVLGLCGQGPFHVDEGWRRLVGQLGNWLADPTGLNWLNALSSKLHLPIVLPLFAMLVAWALLRFVELILQFEDPRRTSFWIRLLVHILIISRYMVLVFFVGYAMLSLDPKLSPESAFTAWQPQSFDPAPYPIVLLIGAGFAFLLLQHRATSVKLSVQFEELKWWKENLRRLQIDLLRVGMIFIAVFVVYVISSHLSVGIRSGLGQILFPPSRVLLVLVLYVFVGLYTAYFIGLILFIVVRLMERADHRRFSSAEGLTNFDNSSVYAREEGGTNTYQNHLVSLTYVKPGFPRRWFLSLTLFFIGLLSRFWFNIGELGGIPTILSARWVLIDGGRRLLFLDHYGGAWDSYLNEFIDMGAVVGLNGIWTNTFVKVHGSQYAFPETEYYFWKGAQVERPFKAYVRQSQIETIVWYSAYPVPATVNINTNTNVRQSLFKPLTSCEIDSLFQNL